MLVSTNIRALNAARVFLPGFWLSVLTGFGEEESDIFFIALPTHIHCSMHDNLIYHE